MALIVAAERRTASEAKSKNEKRESGQSMFRQRAKYDRNKAVAEKIKTCPE